MLGRVDSFPPRCQASCRRAVSSHRTPGLEGGGGLGWSGVLFSPALSGQLPPGGVEPPHSGGSKVGSWLIRILEIVRRSETLEGI